MVQKSLKTPLRDKKMAPNSDLACSLGLFAHHLKLFLNNKENEIFPKSKINVLNIHGDVKSENLKKFLIFATEKVSSLLLRQQKKSVLRHTPQTTFE